MWESYVTTSEPSNRSICMFSQLHSVCSLHKQLSYQPLQFDKKLCNVTLFLKIAFLLERLINNRRAQLYFQNNITATNIMSATAILCGTVLPFVIKVLHLNKTTIL